MTLNRVLADAELIEPEALLCNPSVSMICLRSCIGAGGLVLGVEVFSDGGNLTKLELSEAQAAPALRRTHNRAEHELEHRLLAEAIRDDLEPSPLLDEEALQEIRGAGRAAMRHRKPQVGDAGLEVVFEAGGSVAACRSLSACPWRGHERWLAL